MRHLRVGLAQINTTVGDFDGNRARILDAGAAAPPSSTPTSSPSPSWP